MDIKPTSFTISQLLGSEREQYVIPSCQWTAGDVDMAIFMHLKKRQ